MSTGPSLSSSMDQQSARAGDVLPGTCLQLRDEKFESISLQRGVSCEPDFRGESNIAHGSSCERA
jgi:hypothetical protein